MGYVVLRGAPETGQTITLQLLGSFILAKRHAIVHFVQAN